MSSITAADGEIIEFPCKDCAYYYEDDKDGCLCCGWRFDSPCEKCGDENCQYFACKGTICENCNSGLKGTKIHGILCCRMCDNFECKICGLENDSTGELVGWNNKLYKCICDECASKVQKLVIKEKGPILRRKKQ